MKTTILILLISSPLYSKSVSFSDLSVGKETVNIKPRPLLASAPTPVPAADPMAGFREKTPHWHSDPGNYKFINDVKARNTEMDRTWQMYNNHAARHGH